MSRIFINTSDISVLEGITVKRASEIMRTIMDAYQKTRPKKLLIAEYCEYRGIPETVVYQQMKHEKAI